MRAAAAASLREFIAVARQVRVFRSVTRGAATITTATLNGKVQQTLRPRPTKSGLGKYIIEPVYLKFRFVELPLCSLLGECAVYTVSSSHEIVACDLASGGPDLRFRAVRVERVYSQSNAGCCACGSMTANMES